jgi:hypothetical protein
MAIRRTHLAVPAADCLCPFALIPAFPDLATGRVGATTLDDCISPAMLLK